MDSYGGFPKKNRGTLVHPPNLFFRIFHEIFTIQRFSGLAPWRAGNLHWRMVAGDLWRSEVDQC